MIRARDSSSVSEPALQTSRNIASAARRYHDLAALSNDMATIHKEILIAAPAAAVWDAVRDVGAVHKRLVPGVLTDARMEGDKRIVTFANGLVASELIVAIDDEARRVAYASVGGRARHHNSSMQVFPNGTGARLVWITDLLPDELTESIRGLVELGAAAMKRTLDQGR